jgi:hypothetical protein
MIVGGNAIDGANTPWPASGLPAYSATMKNAEGSGRAQIKAAMTDLPASGLSCAGGRPAPPNGGPASGHL